MYAVSYHDTFADLQAPDYRGRGPFDSIEWYALVEKHGTSPLIVELREDGNSIALSLQPTDQGLGAMRHPFAFTWRPLALSGAVSDASLEGMARELRGRSHRVVLDQIDDCDEVGERLARAFRRAGWIARLEATGESHQLCVGGRSFAEYWAERPGPLRTTLKRKAKKVDVEILEAFDPAIWTEYQNVYARSWKDKEKDILLLEEFARHESKGGRLRLGIARHEGRAVAAQLWTMENGVAYIHKLSYDEEFAKLSAGTTLSAAMFEQAIDRDRVERVDFGTGSDSYKRDWMEEIRPTYTLTCIDWRQWRGVRHIARHAFARLARPLRQG
ncbi:GNAT family N-acetyltransferase [Qipengyuania sp. MTN3-11]|uniref:GNAT family N-acetyltransferase n=1 Tax=Qipengyuania sp. MTN3-11 TaxID=3056557 RepID=UPI0036F23226